VVKYLDRLVWPIIPGPAVIFDKEIHSETRISAGMVLIQLSQN